MCSCLFCTNNFFVKTTNTEQYSCQELNFFPKFKLISKIWANLPNLPNISGNHSQTEKRKKCMDPINGHPSKYYEGSEGEWSDY